MGIIFIIFLRYIRKCARKDEKILNDWYDAQDAIGRYVSAFISKLENNLEGDIGTTLEEIDMVSPYETATYQTLLKAKHRAYIAYIERRRNRHMLDKEKLVDLLKDIKDDESLSDRAMKLIFLR